MDLDDRVWRPYDGYPDLAPIIVPTSTVTDALARLRVREAEVTQSAELFGEAADRLTDIEPVFGVRAPAVDGTHLGVAESAAGEVLHSVTIRDGRVVRCFARSASFHDLVLLHNAFHGDVFTDLGFIEASFGLSYAGVAM
ncbi:Ni,Fe-hydrogenase III large subunit [Flexivirga oryzae]|uniref:Ni,Fe-hydrogenase III large subunit n=1 Tax=Flexivirga oryzae TaxID=1794944 RepID=A0A839N9Q2_9MICO|nr:Ni,Fe-hydrogenase III large subunit [Flexivirga oryzae]